MPTEKRSERFSVEITPVAENYLDRLLDWWIFEKECPDVAEQINRDFWDVAGNLVSFSCRFRKPWDTNPAFAELGYRVSVFSPKHHAAFLYRIDSAREKIVIHFVFDTRQETLLTGMVELAKSMRKEGD